jgi:hypothetical protein
MSIVSGLYTFQEGASLISIDRSYYSLINNNAILDSGLALTNYYVEITSGKKVSVSGFMLDKLGGK